MTRMILGVAGLYLVSAGPACPAFPKGHPAAPIAAPAQFPQQVEGFGETVAAAQKAAVAQATNKVVAALEQMTPPVLAGDPSSPATAKRLHGYVTKYLIESDGHEGKEVQLEVGLFKTWVLPLKRDADWNAIVRQEQQAQRGERTVSRQIATGRVVGMLAIVLAAAFGYFRLGLTSQRQWLLAGAATAAAAVGLSYWLM